MSAEPNPETIKLKRKPVRARLTKRTLEALAVPAAAEDGKPGQAWTYDTTTPRLAVCTWSTGARTWYWVGRGCDGRMLRHKLGEYPEITPEQARKLAAKVSAGIANGLDPQQEKWRARREMLLGELLDVYLDRHAKPHKKTWERDRAIFELHLGDLKSRYLSSLPQGEISTLHVRIGRDHGRYTANRVLALLSKMYTFALTLGFPGPNPVRGIQRFKEKSRDRFLSGEELGRFFAALGEETGLFQDFFRVLLLTGVRRGNVQAMRFDQLDLEGGTWRIPETKNGQPLAVHLHAEAVEILKGRLAESDGRPWVFPGRGESGHLAEVKSAWARIVKRAGLADLRPHDLRRTLGSWQAATGASLPVIGKSLGHKSQAATAVYARLNLDPVRAAVDTAVAAMLAAAGDGRHHETGGPHTEHTP
jgi:integrase